MQFLPHRKDPLVTLVCLSVRNLDLTKMSLRVSVRRKATSLRGVVWKTLLHRGEDERILKCVCMIVDIEQRTGWYVMTSEMWLGWFVVVWLGLSVSSRVIAWTRWIWPPPPTILLSPHFPGVLGQMRKTPQFSRPDISFGLYGNACYAGYFSFPKEVRPCLTKYWKYI